MEERVMFNGHQVPMIKEEVSETVHKVSTY
jgi:hypothetical protein